MNSSFLLEIGVRSAVVLAAAWVALELMRRRSAAERHFVMAFALAVVVLIPAGFLALPEWGGKVRPVAGAEPLSGRVTASVEGLATFATARQNAVASGERSRSVRLPFDRWLAVLIFGAVGQAGWLAIGARHLRGVRLRARRFDMLEEIVADAGPFPGVLLSDETRVAFLAGLFRPVIVLPSGADAWPVARLRMVLCHELAHLRRRDHWVVVLCHAVRVLYWWHPLAWMAVARLRKERERACDDVVLGRFRATDYAELLVISARAAGAGCRPRLAMASPSSMEGRVRAILDGSLSRGGIARGAAGGICVGAIGAMVLASVVRLVAADGSPPPAWAEKVELTEDSAPRPADRNGEESIQIETKLVEMQSATAEQFHEALDPVMKAKGAVSKEIFQACIRALDQKRGVDLMTAPRVSIRPGQKATVAVTREFKYGVAYEKNAAGKLVPARFEKRDIGVELEIQPTVSGDSIVLNGRLRLTEFEGMIDGEDGVQMPVFDVKEARFLREVGDGQSAGLWAFARADEQIVTDRMPDGTEKQSRQVVTTRMAIFLTARLVDSVPAATTPASRNPRRAPTSESLPYGTPVEGKPGFVTSPYAAFQGNVDVRGFPPNTEVKCPYSGKIFLVP